MILINKLQNTTTYKHTCICCEIDFYSSKKYDKFCNKCNITLSKCQKNKYIRKQKLHKVITCQFCKQKFIRQYPKQKFCSKACAGSRLSRDSFAKDKNNEDNQLCWTCAHTNSNECPWFEIPPTINPHSNATKTDTGYKITKCSDYTFDERLKNRV